MKTKVTRQICDCSKRNQETTFGNLQYGDWFFNAMGVVGVKISKGGMFFPVTGSVIPSREDELVCLINSIHIEGTI